MEKATREMFTCAFSDHVFFLKKKRMQPNAPSHICQARARRGVLFHCCIAREKERNIRPCSNERFFIQNGIGSTLYYGQHLAMPKQVTMIRHVKNRGNVNLSCFAFDASVLFLPS